MVSDLKVWSKYGGTGGKPAGIGLKIRIGRAAKPVPKARTVPARD